MKYRGWIIERGDYLYANHNRASRWYIRHVADLMIDRRVGYLTRQAARDVIDEIIDDNERLDAMAVELRKQEG